MREEEVIFNYWNVKKIITHKKTSTVLKRIAKQRKRKADYSLTEILEAIDNYAMVVNGPNYWWDYKWPLWEFLQRENSEKFFPGNFVDKNYVRPEGVPVNDIKDRLARNPYRK